MNTFIEKLTLLMLVLPILLSCSSVNQVNQLSPDERVHRIVEAVRNGSSKGFLDIDINYTRPDLNISGHAYSPAYVASLMRSAIIDKNSSLQLIEIRPEIYKGVKTVAFKLVESGIGNIQNWHEPISMEYLPSSSVTEMSGDLLHLYSYRKYAYIGLIGNVDQRKAIVRTDDGVMFSLKVGASIGSENLVIKEIRETSLILVDSDRMQYVLAKTIVINDRGEQ